MEKIDKDILKDLESNLTAALTVGKGALFEFNVNDQMLYLSESYYRWLGYNSYEKAKKNSGLIDYIHLNDRARVEKIFTTFTDNEMDWVKTEFRVTAKSGQIHWVACHGKALKSPSDGRYSKILGLIFDITNQKEIEFTCSESERKLRTLMNNLPGMAYRNELIDGKWRIQFVSAGVKELLGYDVEHYLAHRKKIYKNIIDQKDYLRIWDQVNKAIKTRHPFELIYRIRTAHKIYKWVWEKGEIIYTKAGRPIAMEGFIMDITKFKHEELRLQNSLKSSMRDRYRFCEIVGKSDEMQKVYERILAAGNSDANVIITGESGTGKELVARAIHQNSSRQSKPMITVNCGAIPKNLLESEFFGYRKGAFTGATEDKKGFLAAAKGGTLFLDEIGEITLEFQVKLLRILEGHEYTPIGGNTAEKFDVRIISATNRNLEKLVKDRKMRQDFFYRIHIIPISVPPLRERGSDVALLIDYFLQKYRTKNTIKEIPDTLRTAFIGYHWPGNIRELENTIHRFAVLGETDFIGRTYSNSDRKVSVNHPHLASGGLKIAMANVEKQIILNTLEANKWRRDKTAAELGITLRTLYRKIVDYRLQ